MTARRAIVLGGGVAGITAAFTLRDRGFAVELFEGHRVLGGRAFTLPQRDGEPAIDNGPHVILGCYDEFRALLRRIGSEQLFARSSRLELAYRDSAGRASWLRLLPGPVPLTFPFALLRLRGLSLQERLRALRGLLASLFIPKDGCTFAEWLGRHAQQGAPRRYLWDPMCRSILNAEAEEVDAALMLSTLDQAFGGSGARAAIWIPSAPWSAIVGEPALARLRQEQVEVRLGARVQSIAVQADRVTAIQFADGSVRNVAHDEVVVSALPWHVIAKVAPDVGVPPALTGKPMVTVAFFVDGDPGYPKESLIALVDGDPFHFFCRRAGDPPGHFALLSGGARGIDDLPADEVVERARDQLRRHFPGVELPADLRARITKEAQATLLPCAGEASLRPPFGPHPRIVNLTLCGDWTDTGLPSTLEGAARSGRDAVDWIWPMRGRRLRSTMGFLGACALGIEVSLAVFGTSLLLMALTHRASIEPVDLLAAAVALVMPIPFARWFAPLGWLGHVFTVLTGAILSALATTTIVPVADFVGMSRVMLQMLLLPIAAFILVCTAAFSRLLR